MALRPAPAVAAAHAAAAVAVAGATGLIAVVPGASHFANVPLLYLLVVLGVALWCGRGPAITASLLAFLAFDWFFVEPRYTLTVGNPDEWLALLVFLVTAVVTGHLTALLRTRAEEARRREREAAALAEASWAVASQPETAAALREVLRRLAEVVEPMSAAILVPAPQGGVAVAAAWGEAPAGDPASAARLLAAPPAGAWLPAAGEPARLFAPLAAEGAVVGVLEVMLRPGQQLAPPERRVAESLANHAAVVLRRDRLARAEAQALALAEADRLKTALLAMVSHDFRSPLASIKAGATTLLEESAGGAPPDPETQRELLLAIDHEADRLNGMVGNILALSRLEADAWRPRREAVAPADLLGVALRSFGPTDNERIRVNLAEAPPELWLDTVQMVQVLVNLLDNALKYSPPGSPVEIRVQDSGGAAVVEVLDRGPGLLPGDEERVFERFYRAAELRESATPGVGIGLAVCRGLVEAHGGRLTARNREGGGAAFRLVLPAAKGEGESRE